MNKKFIQTLGLSAILAVGFGGKTSATECMILDDPKGCNECCAKLYSYKLEKCTAACWERKEGLMLTCGNLCIKKYTNKYKKCYNRCMSRSSATSTK